jgi:succinate dehydrogenase / fumarate reductase flavoprotein subunit
MTDASSQQHEPITADLSGRQLGDYRLLRRLGRGAMAEVYLAEQCSLNRQVAVKILRPELATDQTYIQRFQREARAAASLVHANIVQIHEVGCIDHVHFIAQEYVEGLNLRQCIARNGSLELRMALIVMRQVAAGKVTMFPRREMLELVLVDGKARGILARNLITGEIERHAADAVVLATGGYGNVYFLSTNAMACNVTAAYRAYKKGAFFANPCFTQIHPTCIPVHGTYQSKLTLMSESLRNDGRVWVPKDPEDNRPPQQIPEEDRDYYLERKYPSFGNLVPRDVASRNAKEQCDQGKGVGDTGLAVYLDFSDAIDRDGKDVIEKKYGNLFEMYEKITGDNPYETPMMIYPAVHYTMGGLWVDYNLMSTVEGLFVLGEANFSDHGANRLGASALMQGLADGYFVIPYTIGGYLAGKTHTTIGPDHTAFDEAESRVKDQVNKLLSIDGKRTVDDFHRQLGMIMWDYCGMSRNNEGLAKARGMIQELRSEFWQNVKVPGQAEDLNQSLERAGRVVDFLEFAELMVIDALDRQESCGGHFNEAYQTEDNEAKRDDENYCHVSAWEYAGADKEPVFHKEPLEFENVQLTQRSYK